MDLQQKPARELPSVLGGSDTTMVLFTMVGCEPCSHLKAAIGLASSDVVQASIACEYDGRDSMGRSAMLRRGVKSYPTLLLYRDGIELGRFGNISMDEPLSELAGRIESWIKQSTLSLKENSVSG